MCRTIHHGPKTNVTFYKKQGIPWKCYTVNASKAVHFAFMEHLGATRRQARSSARSAVRGFRPSIPCLTCLARQPHSALFTTANGQNHISPFTDKLTCYTLPIEPLSKLVIQIRYGILMLRTNEVTSHKISAQYTPFFKDWIQKSLFENLDDSRLFIGFTNGLMQTELTYIPLMSSNVNTSIMSVSVVSPVFAFRTN